MPWSAKGDPYKLVEYGNTNVAGRWIARIDEKVEIGGCSNDSKGDLSFRLYHVLCCKLALI